MAMIETEDLTKRYGDLTAVEGMNLTVEEGSIHGFVGPNGAGKTTTMQMLVGLLEPSEGEVYIDGEPAGTIEANRAIGYSPQEPAFYESMSGLAYLKYMGRIAGMRSDVSDRANELLDWMGLEDAKHQTVDGYSGGMRRRLGMAQAMIHDPELLILDEPTAALDPAGRMAIIESLQELTDDGMTVFVSSHVLAELEQFIDTVTIINDGQLVQTGPIDDIGAAYGGGSFALDSSDNDRLGGLLRDHPTVDRVQANESELTVFTEDPDEFKQDLIPMLAEEELVLDLLKPEGGLEDAFSDLVERGEIEMASEAGQESTDGDRTGASGEESDTPDPEEPEEPETAEQEGGA